MFFLQLRDFLVRFLAVCVALCALASLGGVAQAETANKKSSKESKAVGPTVAVLYFDYSGNDEELAFLRKGLTQMLVTDLSESQKLRLVERIDLEAVLKELDLNRSKKIDKASANRIGKLLGARYLVTGGYFEFQGRLRVDAKVIDVETGVVKGIGVLHDSANFLTLEAELALKLHGQLLALHKIKAAAPKKTARRRRPAKGATQTPKVAARTVARYGKALDAIDHGDKKIAVQQLEAITSDDPYFKPAAAELKVLLR
jgi:TolB-like protein